MPDNAVLQENRRETGLSLLCCVVAVVHLCSLSAFGQVQTEKGQVVARCGVSLKKDQSFSFDAKGSPQKQAGYCQGTQGKTYTLRFRDVAGRNALLLCKGRIAWDEQGGLLEGKDNFVAIMTPASDGKWYDVVSTELTQGGVSVTTATGVYTDFSESSVALPTTRASRMIVLDQDGHLVGEPSFILSNFVPNFDAAGKIGKDMRNYKLQRK